MRNRVAKSESKGYNGEDVVCQDYGHLLYVQASKVAVTVYFGYEKQSYRYSEKYGSIMIMTQSMVLVEVVSCILATSRSSRNSEATKAVYLELVGEFQKRIYSAILSKLV